MGLAGVRTSDNIQFFDSEKPLCVVYFDIDYEMNPKGQLLAWLYTVYGENLLIVMGLHIKYLFFLFVCVCVLRKQLLEKQVWLWIPS